MSPVAAPAQPPDYVGDPTAFAVIRGERFLYLPIISAFLPVLVADDLPPLGQHRIAQRRKG